MKIHVLHCSVCGEEVSGPDSVSVTETMERHRAEKDHYGPAAMKATAGKQVKHDDGA